MSKSNYHSEQASTDLNLHRLISGMMLVSLVTGLIVAHWVSPELRNQFALPEAERLWVRTSFYVVGILTLPMTNLIRHISVRLNQTMPGPKPAKLRYLTTVLISMVLVETIGILGLVMYMLGDDFNTLYIMVGMSALGMFLYRPKLDEYYAIVEALKERDSSESE